jgi:hypothetical protein
MPARRFPPPWSVEVLDGPRSAHNNGPVTFHRPNALAGKGPIPMILVLMMAFEISLALALGFVLGRIYQIRHHELERHDGFALPHTARIPQP